MNTPRNPRPRKLRSLACSLLLLAPMVVLGTPQAQALPANFQDKIVLQGLTNPTVLKFSPDGRIFVGEKSGVIKVFDSLTDTTPDVFADLSPKVNNYWDRGLLGLELHPNFPATPSVYALYAHEAPIGGTAPTWNDQCPSPPGPTTDGCLVSGRLSKLTADGNVMTGVEQVLIEDWCQQYPSHSVGSLLFGRDGMLYVSGGEGASFNTVDYGQLGGTTGASRPNPCGDPPSPAGTALTSPTAQGGALRSQSARRTGAAVLGGSILRVDPQTGQGLPDNPFASSTDPNKRRIVAYGLRNPFRFTQRPGTDELWVGDVGWSTWEEINRLVSPIGAATPAGAPERNFGWPCFEGAGVQSGYAGLTQCGELYTTPPQQAAPYFAYRHRQCVVAVTNCDDGLRGSSVTGVAFYPSGSYPTTYTGALFFADHSRNEIWAMMPGVGGLPNTAAVQCFVCANTGAKAANPVDLKIGPNNDLFYVDMEGGAIHRITYTSGNQAPTARISADKTSGASPLTVAFDGSGSTDPEGFPLTYSWDLDGNGTFGDATTATTSHTYQAGGVHQAALRVTDNQGASNTATIAITVGNSPPSPVIDLPASGTTWQVGDSISFSGHATDAEDGALPASALSWKAVVQHCTTSTNCHPHELGDPQALIGVSSGQISAPDHSYPSWIDLRLTATDSGGLTTATTLRLDPRTVQLTFKTNPGGLKISQNFYGEARTTPFTMTAIVGAQLPVGAPSPQPFNRASYLFQRWSDGGAQNHTIIAPSINTAYIAYYKKG